VLGPGKDGPLHKMLYPVPGAPFLSPWKLGLGGPSAAGGSGFRGFTGTM
jgi:hypothetical protein